jgi:hypothetical protein
MQIAAMNRGTGRNSEAAADARPIPSLRQTEVKLRQTRPGSK